MRSCIFCTSYFNGSIASSFSNPYQYILSSFKKKRMDRWIKYYSERTDFFGVERIFIIDDGSNIENIDIDVKIIDAEDLPDHLPDGIILFRFNKHLGRKSLREFPGWWRSFSFSHFFVQKYGFDKVIHIESDAFVISKVMASFIKDESSGWTCFYCPMYDFPETAIQVICRDSIDKIARMWSEDIEFWNKSMLAEFTLPFTSVNKCFNGDRYSEDLNLFFKLDMNEIDYICQSHPLFDFSDRLKTANIKSQVKCKVLMELLKLIFYMRSIAK